jgi:Ca2+-binding EF-hand superfamily protein
MAVAEVLGRLLGYMHREVLLSHPAVLTRRCAAVQCPQEKFEEIFSKYDKESKGGFYYRDLLKVIFGNRNVRPCSL